MVAECRTWAKGPRTDYKEVFPTFTGANGEIEERQDQNQQES